MRSDQVRGFYTTSASSPAWSTREAPVRCFAQPDAHNRGDRSPSCSGQFALRRAELSRDAAPTAVPTMPRLPSVITPSGHGTADRAWTR